MIYINGQSSECSYMVQVFQILHFELLPLMESSNDVSLLYNESIVRGKMLIIKVESNLESCKIRKMSDHRCIRILNKYMDVLENIIDYLKPSIDKAYEEIHRKCHE